MLASYKLKLLKSFKCMRQCTLRGFPESQYKWLRCGRYGRMRLGSNKRHFGVGWRGVW